MSQQDSVINTYGLGKRYDDFWALKPLDMTVPSHSISGFLGPNGAGKSTTIKLLLGLRRPTEGSGTILGLDIVEESTPIRHRVGYLAQGPHFYPNLTARETLRFVARFFYGDANTIEKMVDESLELVGLQGKADRIVRGFSGGERQRLGIAQAQINRPELLILDEPVAALDPMGRECVLAIMEQLRNHSTIFYSTHILDDVQRVSDRVVILNRGQLVAQGPIEVLLRGREGPVYHLEVTGETALARERLIERPSVADVRTERSNCVERWEIGVRDEEVAKTKLLRSVLEQESVDVLSYGKARVELEGIFMQLVEEK